MLRPNTMPAAPALVTARELDDLVLGLKLRAAETDHRHRTALDAHRHLERVGRAHRLDHARADLRRDPGPATDVLHRPRDGLGEAAGHDLGHHGEPEPLALLHSSASRSSETCSSGEPG